MTRQEAIQEQIDLCMDRFDFELCAEALEIVKKRGGAYPESWLWAGKFSPAELRQAARKLLKEVAAAQGEYYETTCSYLRVQKREGLDEDGPWIRLYLSFSLEDNLAQDATGYEKNPAKAEETTIPHIKTEGQ